MEQILHDIRYAARQLVRAPMFTIVSAISLGIAIAVAVTAYSFVDAVLFKALPLPQLDRLVHINAGSPRQGFGSAYTDIEAYRASGAFSGVTAVFSDEMTVGVKNQTPAREGIELVTSDYFQVLGVHLIAGRGFSNDGTGAEIIITDRFQHRHYTKDEPVIGSIVKVNKAAFTVVGIAPAGFLSNSMLVDGSPTIGWLPAQAAPTVYGGRKILEDPERRYWFVRARLANGVTASSANTRLTETAYALAMRYPTWRDDRTNRPLDVRIITYAQDKAAVVRKSADVLGSLAVLVGVILLLACTNVAGLLLSRSVTRRHEVAVRLTLGATRGRIGAQFMIEALLLSFAGGATGACGAVIAIAMAHRNPSFDSLNLTPDWRVFLATLATCIGCAVAFGATPIAQTVRRNVNAGLSGLNIVGERSSTRGRLIAFQVALSCTLLVIGLHASRGVRARIGSIANVHADAMVVADINAEHLRNAADTVAFRKYVGDAVDVLRASPSVASIAIATAVPQVKRTERMDLFQRSGAAPQWLLHVKVSSTYFETLGIRTVSGNVPHSGESFGGRTLAVVNRAVQKQFGSNVVGMTIKDAHGKDVVIVAEVDDGADLTAFPAETRLYEISPTPIIDAYTTYLIARVVPGTESGVMAQLARGIRDRYPDRVPPGLSTLRSRVTASVAPQRWVARIAFGFGAVQMVLAAVGLYSLLLYAMLTRTREIGVRMALGAAPRTASYAIMKDGLAYILGGAIIGIALSIPAGVFASKMFVGAEASDIVPLEAAIIAIALTTVVAAFSPARRAMRVEPMEALRYE